MQDRIRQAPPPSPDLPSDKSPETSQILFTRVMQYLETLSAKERLTTILHVARFLQTQQMRDQIKASPEKLSLPEETPFSFLWQKTLQELKNDKDFFALFVLLQASVQKKDSKTFSETFPELLIKWGETGEEAPSQSLKDIFEGLMTFIANQKNVPPKSMQQLLSRLLLGSTSKTLKEKNFSDEDVDDFLNTILTKLGQSPTPSPLKEFAKNTLALMKTPDKKLMLLKEAEEGYLKNSKTIAAEINDAADIKELMEEGMQAGQAALKPGHVFQEFEKKVTIATSQAHIREETQSAIQQELEALVAMLKSLISEDPKDPQNMQLFLYLQNVLQMLKNPNDLTTQDMNNLANIVEGMLNIETKLANNGTISSHDSNNFLNQLEALIQQLMQTTGSSISKLRALVAQLQQELQNTNSASADISYIESLLALLASGKETTLTPDQIQKLLQAIKDLGQRYSSLSSNEQAEVNTLLNALAQLKNAASGTSLASTLADAQIEIWVQQYCNSHHPATVAGLEAYIQQQIEQFPNCPGNSFFTELGLEFHNVLFSPNFPNSGASGISFVTVNSDGTIVPNSNFMNGISSQTSYSSDELFEALTDAQEASMYFLAQESYLQGEINGIENVAIPAIQQVIDSFARAYTNVAIQYEINTGSLPDDFSNAVLNNYMPQQEQYLQEMAALLEYFNLGASMDNSFLDEITGWGDAANTFDFASWYNSMDGKQTAAQEAAQIAAEEKATQNAINQAQALIKQIEAEENKIKNNPNLTSAEKASKLQYLQGLDKSAHQAINNANALYGSLKTAYGDVTQVPPVAIPSALITQIQSQESTLVFGDVAQGGFGGLQAIDSEITTDQSNWSGQSQIQQVKLQMEMTEIQQEWTIVSTALQMLNQMYMTAAQAIYK